MQKINLGQTLNTLANVGVIAGIVFLGFELRQANRIAVVNAEYALRDNYSAVNELVIGNTEVAQLLSELRTCDGELTGAERERALRWSRRLINAWLAVSVSYDNGIATEETYRSIFSDIEFALGYAGPAMRMVWRETIDAHPALSDTEIFRAIDESLARYETGE